ncbi:MAG: hypothetical protein D6744_00925 [Planctomycetota bacterium]|nr:MAG: hypothetical protein D6744_00925 [Planctomycetota bacterium]
MGAITKRVWAVIGGLACAASAQAIDYRGLDHQPLGFATLTIDGADQLVATPIPGGGGSGVTIDLGSAEFWRASMPAFDVSAVTGAWLQFDVTGVVGGSAAAFCSLRLTDLTNRVGVSASYPIAPGFPIDVTVYSGDAIVAAAANVGGMFAVFDPQGAEVEPARVRPTELRSTITFDTPTAIDLIGQPTVSGDRIEITTPAVITYEGLQTVDVTGSDLPDITIRDERLGKFGYALRALGQVTLNATGTCPACTLTVSNIGASGDDGVRVEVLSAEALTQSFSWRNTGAIPDGARLRVAGFGALHGLTGVELASIELEDVGAQLEVRGEFSGVGAPVRTVAVFDSGALVGQLTGQAGPTAARVDDMDWPTRLTTDARVAEFGGVAGFIVNWSTPILIEIAGGPTLTGDQLVVVGESPDDVPLDLTAVEDHVVIIPLLEFVSIGQEESCPGDVDGDDDIDLGDLAQLLANFGMTPADASDGDFDNSNEVDLADLAILLSAFDTTCN